MAIYTTVQGDTFELIARKQYGTEVEAGRIQRANPGLSEPFVAGIVVTIPLVPDAPQDSLPKAASNSIDEVSVLIDGKRFRFWSSIRLTRSIDSMDTVNFSAPFDPDAPGFKETFRPMSFKDLVVSVGGEPLFTGKLVTPLPSLQNDQTIVAVNGYSLPGVLNDCNAPASAFPLEFSGQNLKDIVTTLADHFGISVEFDGEPGPVFEKIACDPTKKILTFLAELAKQRNYIITSTPGGALRFLRTVTSGTPVAKLQEGKSPLLTVTPSFDAQSYFSHITGLQPNAIGLDGSQFTEKNPLLSGVVRPLTFNAPDTLDSDVSEAVKAKLGRMLANAVSYSADVATWRDPNGELWTPNTTLKLLAPGAMIYNEYEFLIRSVDFARDPKTATLNLVLPGSFSGGVPEAFPWD